MLKQASGPVRARAFKSKHPMVMLQQHTHSEYWFSTVAHTCIDSLPQQHFLPALMPSVLTQWCCYFITTTRHVVLYLEVHFWPWLSGFGSGSCKLIKKTELRQRSCSNLLLSWSTDQCGSILHLLIISFSGNKCWGFFTWLDHIQH